MGQLIDFEDRGVAALRRRVAEVEEANQDLIAFARGHSGAVSAIHGAVLVATEADGLDHLVHIVTQIWPDILGLDAVALALVADDEGARADSSGSQKVDPRLIERMLSGVDGVVLRGVGRGHPLFGPAADLIRAEALIRLEPAGVLQTGILALGQRRPQGFETRHGSELLLFLGQVVSRMMGRWLAV
jgi:uncharacterized protein YigA (DUF484 family)